MSNTEEYHKYLKSNKWKRIKKKMHKLYKSKCCICNEKEGLHVHHLHYDNIFDEKLDDLRLLCQFHHSKWHNGTLTKNQYNLITNFNPKITKKKKVNTNNKKHEKARRKRRAEKKTAAMKWWNGEEMTRQEKNLFDKKKDKKKKHIGSKHNRPSGMSVKEFVRTHNAKVREKRKTK